jgi:hypothetical protein
MPTSSADTLPDVLKTLRTRPLFVMRLDVRKLQIIGATPSSYRRIDVVPGGMFEGERLSGEVLEGGSDWQEVRPDGSTTLDVRLVLRTKNDTLIGMTYRGQRHGDSVRIRQNLLVLQTLIDRKTEIVLSAVCHDVLVPDAGQPRRRERIVVFDSEMIPNSFIYPA